MGGAEGLVADYDMAVTMLRSGDTTVYRAASVQGRGVVGEGYCVTSA